MAQSSKPRMNATKRRQLLVTSIILSGVLILIFAAVYMKGDDTKNLPVAVAPEKIESTNLATPNESFDQQQALAAQNSAHRGLQDKRLENLEALISEMKKASGVASSPENEALFPNSANGVLPPAPPRPPEGLFVGQPVSVGNSITSAKPNTGSIETVYLSRPMVANATEATNSTLGTKRVPLKAGEVDTGGEVTTDTNFKTTKEVVNVRGIRPNINIVEDGGKVSYGSDTSYAKFRRRESYIPSGSFLQATLLGGLDAPTGSESKDANVHPVLMKIMGLAQLPNKKRFDLRNCFVLGSGYGDLSSERAYIRIERLSCVNDDGTAIDVGIKGYVAGEDGLTGVRGTLVTKQGQILANALLASGLSGVGSALSAGAQTQSTTALGTTSSVQPGKLFESGLANGMGTAMDRMAQYYIKLAEKTFPVIEVAAGRKVDIVLTQGIQLGEEGKQ